MKIKIALAILALSLSTLTAYSQIRFGVKGGIDVIIHEFDSDALKESNKMGYQIGGTMEALIPSTGFGTELSILYARKEYDLKDKQLDASISDQDYISVPLVLKKRFGITPLLSVFASAGAFVNFKIGGGNLNVGDYVDKFESKDFEAGATAGAGVQLLRNFDLGLYYRATLTDKYAIDDPDWSKLNDKKYQSWSIGLTYFF